MPEDLITKCEGCGLVYNKITYPECPRCRHTRRKKAQKPEAPSPSLSPSPSPSPSSVTPVAGISAFARPSTGPRPSAPPSTAAQAARRPGWRPVLWLAASFLAGAVSYNLGLNIAVSKTGDEQKSFFALLRTIPLIETPRFIDRIKVVRRSERGADGRRSGASAETTNLSDEVLKVTRWTKTLNIATNRVQFKGVVQNVSDTPIAKVTMSLHGLDSQFTEVATDKNLTNPSEIPPQANADFQMELSNDPRVASVVFSGTWSQKVVQDLQRIPWK